MLILSYLPFSPTLQATLAMRSISAPGHYDLTCVEFQDDIGDKALIVVQIPISINKALHAKLIFGFATIITFDDQFCFSNVIYSRK
jgi:hypothetical protein